MKSTYEAYYEAPQAIRDLIDSGLIGNSVEKILSETTYIALKPKVIIACTRNFLSLTSGEELVKELSDLSLNEEVIQTLVVENRKLLSESLRGISQGIESSPVETNTQTSKVPANIAKTNTDIQKEISDAEALLNTLDPVKTVRTMNAGAGSAPAETVYTSTQSAILEEGRLKSLSTPTTPGAAPRWDSAK